MVRTKEKFTEKSQTLFGKVAPKIMKSRKIHKKVKVKVKKSTNRSNIHTISQKVYRKRSVLIKKGQKSGKKSMKVLFEKLVEIIKGQMVKNK